ncbi:MAG TPA: hypothetical protein VGI19_17745 [Candidatus Cybelea sp.]
MDNLSSLSPQMSDALCRLSTGGGFSTRVLYTDEDETIFEGQRPVIITSIVEIAARPDLLDRCFVVELHAIPDTERRTERELWADFEEALPSLFGALLDAASTGLRNLSAVERLAIPKPRMADAYNWTLACAEALGLTQDDVSKAWLRNVEEANASAIESSPIVRPLFTLVKGKGGTWSGTATNLLDRLNNDSLVPDATKRRQDWPKTANSLSAALRRLGPALRRLGVEPSAHRKPGSGSRVLSFTIQSKESQPLASQSSQTSQAQPLFGKSSGSEMLAVTHGPDTQTGSVTLESPDGAHCDNGDACDDDFHPLLETAVQKDQCP